MNLNAYKEYRFTQGTLTSKESGRVYCFRLDKNDRFYTYMKPHIQPAVYKGKQR